MNGSIVLRVGQTLTWPAAPEGWAQVGELRRTNAVLLYRRKGCIVRKLAAAARVAEAIAREPLLFGQDNLLGVAVVPRSKTFKEGAHYGFAKRREQAR